MLILQNEPCFEGMYKKIPVESWDERYTVSVNGRDCFVNRARVSKMPFNKPWGGVQRGIEQTEINGFINFAADEEVEIVVNSKVTVNTALIRPISKKINVSVNDNIITFKLKKHGQYVLEINDQHEAIHIFYDSIVEYKENATYYFGPGVHKCGIITLKDNESIYVDRDAIVIASVFAKDAKNISIFGSGILDGSTEERMNNIITPIGGCYENMTIGNIRMYNCENVNIDGVILRDSANWTAAFFECNNIKINNMKIIGQWRYNTDGIDLTNTSNVTITNSFVRSFDDSISIKGIYDYEKYIENIKVDNCVLWCGWGKACEIGAETSAKGYKDIYFENVDCIHNSIAAMDIQNCNDADIHHIYFKNVNVEYSMDEQVKMIQDEENPVYIPKDYPEVCAFIKLDNRKTVYKFEWENGIYGPIHDIFFENVNAYVENEEVIKPVIHICSHNPECEFSDIHIDNISINDIIGLKGFEIVKENSDNVFIDKKKL